MADFARLTKTITVQMWRRPTAAELEADPTMNRYQNIADGTLTGDVTVKVDVESLFNKLATKALRSAGKRAIKASGLVDVRATNIRKGV